MTGVRYVFCLAYLYLVRGRNRFGFLYLHLFTAAGKFALAGFSAERLGAAFRAAISFS